MDIFLKSQKVGVSLYPIFGHGHGNLYQMYKEYMSIVHFF